MKKIVLAGCLALLSAQFTLANAATAQQNRMKECNAQAKGKKGDERKAFMKTCLSGKHASGGDSSGGKSAQKEKRKSCSKEASQMRLKRDEKQRFMADCLKG